MISFKQYKLLQENLGRYTLGVQTPKGIGVSEAPMLDPTMKKKKIHGGMQRDDVDIKKKPHKDDMDDEEDQKVGDMDTADDMDIDEPFDEETPDIGDDGDDDMNDVGDDDINDDGGDDTGDEDDDDISDETEPNMDMSDDSSDMGDEDDTVSPPIKGGQMKGRPIKGRPMSKKTPTPPSPMTMKKMDYMKKMNYMKKEQMNDDEENEINDKIMKKKPVHCSKCKKSMKKEAKEENEFLSSLKRQCGTTKFAPDEFGYWGPVQTVQEDVLITPTKSEQEEKKNEPIPGDVGYAPIQRIGSVSGFQEWSRKYKTKK